jgi:hypothetical protein
VVTEGVRPLLEYLCCRTTDDDSKVKIAELLPLEQSSLANPFSKECMINF